MTLWLGCGISRERQFCIPLPKGSSPEDVSIHIYILKPVRAILDIYAIIDGLSTPEIPRDDFPSRGKTVHPYC